MKSINLTPRSDHFFCASGFFRVEKFSLKEVNVELFFIDLELLEHFQMESFFTDERGTNTRGSHA